MNQHARVEEKQIPFIDVAAQRRRLGRAIDDAVARVLAHCQFVQGPEVRALEAELAAFCGARHAIGCASGTDALLLVLMAWQIGRGDAVICPSFTFHATAEMVVLLGATPIIADVSPDTFNLDPASCERAVATAKRVGLKPRAIIPVDLFGLPADHDAINAIAAAHGLLVLDDAAQAFGATYRGRKLGALTTATATSFFPAKPLGCYGDGGAVFTDDDALAARVRSSAAPRRRRRPLRGGAHRHYRPARHHPGGDSDRKAENLSGGDCRAQCRGGALFGRPRRRRDRAPDRQQSTSVWAQYTMRLKPGRRDALAAALKAEGIPTAIYYTKPLHRQPAYRDFPVADGGVPVSEQLSQEVISLPMHAYLERPVQDRIIDAVRRALAS